MEKQEMTKERLESYRSCKEEIQELQYKLDHLGEGDSMIGNDTIFDYKTGYPRPQSVVGYDHKREERLRALYETRIEKLQKECTEIEEWVEAIPDSLTRRIFRMYYIDGLGQNKIAKRVHIAQSEVSKKISKYLQLE